jgi:two-component system NarL family sensor kinase
MQESNGSLPGNVPPRENSGSAQPKHIPPAESVQRPISGSETVRAECAEFERILAGVANQLSNAAEGQFDEVVTACLRQLTEFLAFDRGTILAFSEQFTPFRVTHSWEAEGVPCPARDTVVDAKLPWYTHQIRSGYIVRISSRIDLPSTATQERTYLLESGLKSNISIPLVIEQTVIGAVAFGAFHAERRLPRSMVSRLRLVGEVLALALRRNQYAEGLKALAHSVDQMSLGPARQDRWQDEHMRRLAVHLMQTEHQERRRMGDVVHEDVMQLLASIGMFLETAREGDAEACSSAISKTQGLLRQAVAKLRHLAVELRPAALSATGLVEGIRWLADEMRRTHDLHVDVEADDLIEPVNEDVRPFLYDAALKLLENVATHSQCKRARVEIRRVDPGHIQLTVTDKGVGFTPAAEDDVPSGSFGLFSVREQAELLEGRLDVHSAPGEGTRASVTRPT